MMASSTQIIFIVMVISYIIAKSMKVSTELSMFIAALGGGLAGGSGIPARHIVEGSFTYLDITLIFITATLFMNLLKESGGVAYVSFLIIWNTIKTKKWQEEILYIIILIPFLLRLFRLK